MGALLDWPTREPGRPYRWVLSLDDDRPAPSCLEHRGETTDRLGVCAYCVSAWRADLLADPYEWTVCVSCGYPLHPVVEAGGRDTCPTCDIGPAAAVG